MTYDERMIKIRLLKLEAAWLEFTDALQGAMSKPETKDLVEVAEALIKEISSSNEAWGCPKVEATRN